MSSIELGGFAENPNVIDGTKEEFIAFNYCLAEDYYYAVLNEDFDSLGEGLNDGYTWHEIMSQVCYWLNYNGEIGKDKQDYFDKLRNGTILTVNDRTFIDASKEHGWTKLSDDLISKIEENGKQLKKIKNR